MTKNHYVVETVSNYATSALEETLNRYGHRGFKLVSTIMGKNKYGAEVMYLFLSIAKMLNKFSYRGVKSNGEIDEKN